MQLRRVAAVAALAVALAACGEPDVTSATALPATAGCDAAERQTLQEGGHLLGDAPPPVPYSSVPPTSGWHASGRGVTPGTYAEALSEPEIVLWLEKGGIVVTYAPTLADAQIRELSMLPSQVELTVVTPYETSMPTPIALAGWGWLQRCQNVTPVDAQAFLDAYAGLDRSD